VCVVIFGEKTMSDKTWNAIQTRWSNLRQSIGTDAIDALLDAFLLIYDESSRSTSVNDKAIEDFQDFGSRFVLPPSFILFV
jgi:hypothetical protein